MLGAKVWGLVVARCSREQRVPRLECACLNTHTKRKADLAKGEAALASALRLVYKQVSKTGCKVKGTACTDGDAGSIKRAVGER